MLKKRSNIILLYRDAHSQCVCVGGGVFILLFTILHYLNGKYNEECLNYSY